MVISLDANNAVGLGFKIGSTMIVFQTMGFKINLLKFSLKVEPTMIGLASIRLDKMWDSIGYKRSNEIGVGFFKITWMVYGK